MSLRIARWCRETRLKTTAAFIISIDSFEIQTHITQPVTATTSNLCDDRATTKLMTRCRRAALSSCVSIIIEADTAAAAAIFTIWSNILHILERLISTSVFDLYGATVARPSVHLPCLTTLRSLLLRLESHKLRDKNNQKTLCQKMSIKCHFGQSSAPLNAKAPPEL